MQLKKFIKEIDALKPTFEELQKFGLPISEQDRWNIDVLDEEFNAYDGPIHQLVYCIDTLQLFPWLEQLNKIDSDAPEPFSIWGINTFYNFCYAYNYLDGEIVLLDDLKSPDPNMYCAASNSRFLDLLYIIAQYEKLRLFDSGRAELDKNEWIYKAAKAAGGEKYYEHSRIIIG